MRWAIVGLAIILAVLQYRLWLGDGSVPDLIQLRSAIAEQRAANEEAAKRNEALAAEVEDLQEGLHAIEERARSELGMIRRDEVFYQVVEE